MEQWITKEEKELVDQLRERISDELPQSEKDKPSDDQDAFLLRWIRARDLNLNKAHDMLSSALKWRKEKDIDRALEMELTPFLKKEFRWAFVSGTDKMGNPVLVSRMADWDFRKILATDTTPEQFDLFLQHLLEDIMRATRNCNAKRKPEQAPITQYTTISDLTGYAYGQMLSIGAMRKWFAMAALYESYYPELLHRVHIFNCPSYFQLFLNMFKGVVAPRTLGKITCYPTLADWQKEMENYVDPAIVPEKFGGTSKEDPFLEKYSVEI